ncbi:MAG: enoyl-CoA hydratase-related protein [Chloroflexota bacterium]
MYSSIKITVNDKFAEITLNRPKQRNALTLDMIQELISALNTIKESDAKGVLLRAEGKSFCSGHDFNDMLARDLAGMRDLMRTCAEMMQLLHKIPQFVVASVNGPAVGAGCQLALSCDMVVAAESAGFRTAGASGGWFCFTPMVAVTRAVGRKRAIEMLTTGDIISAAQASEWGMINYAVPDETLYEESLTLLERATRGRPMMLGLGKDVFYKQIELDESEAYDYAAEIMASTGMLPDAQERMRAFAEKRKPRFE